MRIQKAKGRKKNQWRNKLFLGAVCLALGYSLVQPTIGALRAAAADGEEVGHDAEAGASLQEVVYPAYVVNPYITYTYGDMEEDLLLLQKMYPDLIRITSIGQSVEGRNLYAVYLGKGERIVAMNGTIHAQEYITAATLMYMIDRYAYGYTMGEVWDGYSLQETLESVTFAVVPMINPDGVNLVQNGPDATKNPTLAWQALAKARGVTQLQWKANANGVDLNRNFTARWKEDNPRTPSYAYYGGPYGGSEPETRAVEEFYNNTPYYLNMNFHAQGEIIFWLDANTKHLEEKYSPAVARIGQELHYTVDDVTKNISYGYLADYLNDNFAKVNMTIETCPYVGEIYPEWDFDRMASRLKKVGLIAADIVREMPEMPYGVYRDGVLVQNFDVLAKAQAFAKWYPGGVLLQK